MKDGEVAATIAGEIDEAHIDWVDKPLDPAFYHCRVTMADGNLAVCTPVWVG